MPAWRTDDKTVEMRKQGKSPSKRRRTECRTRTVSSNWQNGPEVVTGDPVGQQRSSACVENAAHISLGSLSGLSVGPFISSASHAT
jgi:hypothetical protein